MSRRRKPPTPHSPPRMRHRFRVLFMRDGDHLTATREGSEPHKGPARGLARLKHALIGDPIASEDLPSERIFKWKALAVFASDALSSVAYATEEALAVLLLAGTAALGLGLPIAGVIALLLAIVALSYRQTIFHYPQGGGTYTVTKDNMGNVPALVAGSALMIDYVLTVAVSVAAGIAAVTSAVPALGAHRLGLALAMVLALTLANLRGVRTSATLFAIPTYMFLASMAGLLAIGAWQVVTGAPPHEAVAVKPHAGVETLGLFLVLRAFASGCAALTGLEAISNGIPAFREPQAKNAAATMTAMAAILATLFLGISFLAHHYAVAPHPDETVVSQIARAVVGHGPFYFLVQAATALILLLAANTSFADFPRLSRFMAEDGFLPRQFALRGDRLSFSVGICVLGAAAAVLLTLFKATTHLLIPLYAIGVFVAFTLSQASMAKRWWTRREPGWRHGIAINAIGTLATGTVALVIGTTKFSHGGWVVVVLLPLMVVGLLRIHAYYQHEDATQAAPPEQPSQAPLCFSQGIVLVSAFNQAGERAMRVARAIVPHVTALHVTPDLEAGRRLREQWHAAHPDVHFELIESPYRSLAAPVAAYLESLEASAERPVLVLLSEPVPRHWWEWTLSDYTGLRLKLALFFLPQVVVLDAPFRPPG